MGALTGFAAAGPGLYGLARGEQDVDRFNDESAGRKTDQAIRVQRLKEDQQTAPLRQKAAELAVDTNRFALDRAQAEAPQRDATLKYQFDAAKLGADDAKRVSEERDKAMKRRSTLEKGLIATHVTGDPQHLADSIGEAYPDEIGKFEAKKDPSTGNITIKGDKFAPHTFEPYTDPTSGKTLTSDQMFQKFGMMALDPVGSHVAQMNNEFAIDKMAATQSAIGDRQLQNQMERNAGALAVANTKADNEKEKRLDTAGRYAAMHVEHNARTKDLPGGFALAYTNDDVAALVPATKVLAYKYAKQDQMDPPAAADKARQEVGVAFQKIKSTATKAAQGLGLKGINWQDDTALDAAAKGGNQDAIAMQRALKAASVIGKDIPAYLKSQVPVTTGK